MSEMVERVAKALQKLRMRQDPLMFEDAARTAIAAMREPDMKMIEAGNTALDNATDSDWDSGPDGESHNSYTTIRSTAPFEIFQAMCDEALK